MSSANTIFPVSDTHWVEGVAMTGGITAGMIGTLPFTSSITPYSTTTTSSGYTSFPTTVTNAGGFSGTNTFTVTSPQPMYAVTIAELIPDYSDLSESFKDLLVTLLKHQPKDLQQRTFGHVAFFFEEIPYTVPFSTLERYVKLIEEERNSKLLSLIDVPTLEGLDLLFFERD
jgi:hypothetical protein